MVLPCLTRLLKRENSCPDVLAEHRDLLQSQLLRHRRNSLIFTALYHMHQPSLKFKLENTYFGDLLFSCLDYPKMGWMEPKRWQTPTYTHTRSLSLTLKSTFGNSVPPSFPWLQICSPAFALIHVLPSWGKNQNAPFATAHETDGCGVESDSNPQPQISLWLGPTGVLPS